MTTEKKATRGAEAGIGFLGLDLGLRNAALDAIAASLRVGLPKVLQANATDLEDARLAGLAETLLKRLAFDAEKITC